MAEHVETRGVDIPIDKLTPLHKRQVSFGGNNGYRKILASIREIGLIQPLCVHQEGDAYMILDGYVRYRACQELGVKVLPCLVYPDKEAYTFNRMVNHLSPVQEARMIRKSLELIDEKTIARTFGMQTIAHRLSSCTTKRLHPEVAKAFDHNEVTRACVGAFSYVLPQRQLAILGEMRRAKDFSLSFVRAMVFRTPPEQRNRGVRRKSPWEKDPSQKKELVTKLEAVEKRYDFYSGLYRQYSADLLRLCIYVRKVVSNERLRAHIQEHFPEQLKRFEGILFETDGSTSKKAGVGVGKAKK